MPETPRKRPRVILRHCDTYDAERIRAIVREGLDELGLRPSGRTLVKPNLVAAGPLFEHAHTHPVFAEGVLRALRDRDGGMSELAVGERCGITIPTRVAFEGSGFDEMLARVGGVKRYCFEEEPQVEIPLRHPQRLRDYVFTPEPVAKADFFVNMPKFKAHPWTTVTFSTKAYIGIQDDRHRLIDHDHRLDEKIADLQHIVQPQFIVIDAIVAGEGRMLTPIPYKLNLIIMGDNQIAFDSICCRLIGVDPATVPHIRLSHEHGFGPLDPAEIELGGDVSFEEARERGRAFKVGLIRVEKYFEGTSISAYAGPPPEAERTDYCWGGCPGAIEEAIEILRLYDQQCDQKLPRMHVVFGDYRGPIPAKPGEKVIFMGDCAQWQGKLGERLVQIRSVYKDRSTKDPHKAKHDDIFAKMAGVTMKLARAADEPYVRFEGCPVSVAEQVLALVNLGGLKNPYFDASQIVQFTKGYMGWKSATAVKRLRGVPYQKPGAAERGKAMPATETHVASAGGTSRPAGDAE
jgi:uncharacterized protein (DUF362 family)